MNIKHLLVSTAAIHQWLIVPIGCGGYLLLGPCTGDGCLESVEWMLVLNIGMEYWNDTTCILNHTNALDM